MPVIPVLNQSEQLMFSTLIQAAIFWRNVVLWCPLSCFPSMFPVRNRLSRDHPSSCSSPKTRNCCFPINFTSIRCLPALSKTISCGVTFPHIVKTNKQTYKQTNKKQYRMLLVTPWKNVVFAWSGWHPVTPCKGGSITENAVYAWMMLCMCLLCATHIRGKG